MQTSAWLSSLIAVLLVAVAVGCGPSLSPEEQIAVTRAQYGAKLTSWTVDQEPAEPLEPDAEGGDAEGEAADAEASETAAPKIKTDVLLDILLSVKGADLLPRITLDLTQNDSTEAEKGRRTLWVDSSDVREGIGVQITHVLVDVDYETGDRFHVEVRSPIPPEERSAYREFDAP